MFEDAKDTNRSGERDAARVMMCNARRDVMCDTQHE